MKKPDDLLLLGDPRLYQVCDPVLEKELPQVQAWMADMEKAIKK